MYIDSNIFIFAAADTGTQGEQCRAIITMLDEGDINAASSYLVIDEVLWVLQHETDRMDAAAAARTILSLPIRWINLKRAVTVTALHLYEDIPLDPRDAFHIAIMKSAGLTTILSEDDDFDALQGIQRTTPADLLQERG